METWKPGASSVVAIALEMPLFPQLYSCRQNVVLLSSAILVPVNF